MIPPFVVERFIDSDLYAEVVCRFALPQLTVRRVQISLFDRSCGTDFYATDEVRCQGRANFRMSGWWITVALERRSL
jgi:hypothetical protein